jgi:hypothetical protein
MPLLLIKHAFRERIQARTGLYGDVGDNEALVVQGEMAVDRLRENAVSIVDEEN